MTEAGYLHVREDGATFALVAGHEKPDYEEMVERNVRFVIVRKFGVAGVVAEQRDPNT
jgi:hypothetical protein